MDHNNNTVSKFAPHFEINETPFVIKIGKKLMKSVLISVPKLKKLS